MQFKKFVLAAMFVMASIGCGTEHGMTPNVTPSQPAMTVLSQLQDSTGWKTCGACGNTGATGPVATFSITHNIAAPSLSGSAAQFNIAGTQPYANAYWWIPRAPQPDAKVFVYEFDLLVPGQFVNAPQAIEWEIQQNIGGHVFNYAWQSDYAGKQFRIFNYSKKSWEATQIPWSAFAPDRWHHISSEFERTDDGRTHHVALTIDGTRYVVDAYHAFFDNGKATDNQFTNAFQLDLRGTTPPPSYWVYVDNMTLSYR